jgi:hypothetical protein
MLGRELGDIIDQRFTKGKHSTTWHAGGLPQGRYFYRLQTDDNVEVRSLMIVK